MQLAAAVLDVDVNTVDEWKRRKLVPFFKVGRVVRFEHVGMEAAGAQYRGRQERLREWVTRLEINQFPPLPALRERGENSKAPLPQNRERGELLRPVASRAGADQSQRPRHTLASASNAAAPSAAIRLFTRRLPARTDPNGAAFPAEPADRGVALG